MKRWPTAILELRFQEEVDCRAVVPLRLRPEWERRHARSLDAHLYRTTVRPTARTHLPGLKLFGHDGNAFAYIEGHGVPCELRMKQSPSQPRRWRDLVGWGMTLQPVRNIPRSKTNIRFDFVVRYRVAGHMAVDRFFAYGKNPRDFTSRHQLFAGFKRIKDIAVLRAYQLHAGGGGHN